MNVYIRRANLADLHAVSALSQQLFEYEQSFTNEYDLAWSVSPDGQKYFSKRLKGRSNFILVAETDGSIVGYISLWIGKPSGRLRKIIEIENLCVDRSFRGKGIGKQLLQEASHVAKIRKIKRLRVTALSDNDLALQFYRTNGYSDVDIVLEKDIT